MTAESHVWADIAGRMEGERHLLPVRVYYEDTDFSGVVYHAAYLRFCERGRTDFLRLAGISHTELGEAGFAFALRRAEADFIAPARIDDLLVVSTRLLRLGGASLTLAQEVLRGPEPLFALLARVAVVDSAGRPARLPENLLRAVAPHQSSEETDSI